MTSKIKRETEASLKTTLHNKARDQLEEQMTAFINRGGEVQQIPNGVSGQVYPAPRRQISLAKESPKAKT